jgi:uncharacterized protein involved in exopolysaccharide biosynthesis
MIILGFSLAISVFILTINMPREYESEAELNSNVSTSVNLGDIGPAPMDFFSTSSKVDNIINTVKSRQTLNEVSSALLSYHVGLGTEASERIITNSSLSDLEDYFPIELLEEWRSERNESKRRLAINLWKKENITTENYHRVFESENSPYGLKSLGKVYIYRIGSSDLMRLTYRWRDSGIAQKTLSLILEVLFDKMKDMNLAMSRDVVAYFEEELEKASQDLSLAEDQMKIFRAENEILNFYEQTEALSVMKENMEDELQKENANFSATKATLVKLERQLQVNKELLRYGRQLLILKDKIADIQRQIAIVEVGGNNKTLLNRLRKEEVALNMQLKTDLLNTTAFERTTDGVDIEKLLESWVDATLALDASEARLEVFEERKAYFDREYRRMTPLGTQLTKIERKIRVREEYFLEVLHGLNQAVLHKQTLSMSSDGLIVSVPATYPSNPLPSKRLFLVIFGFFIGIVLPYLIAFLYDLLDQSIKTKNRAEFFTNKKVIAGFPSKSYRLSNMDVDMSQLYRKSMNQLMQRILDRREKSKSVTINILHFSIYSKKETFIDFLKNALDFEDISYRIDNFSHIEESSIGLYKDYINANEGTSNKRVDVEIVVHPNILEFNYNKSLIQKSAINLYVLNSKSVWRVADTYKLNELNALELKDDHIVLMNVKDYDIENIVGEIPKKRSQIRVFLKRLFDFIK